MYLHEAMEKLFRQVGRSMTAKFLPHSFQNRQLWIFFVKSRDYEYGNQQYRSFDPP